MITTTAPATWQELQQEVARILAECGFEVELEKTVGTVRGGVEVDVFAKESVKGRVYQILCECKHWKSRVPQSVIHGFRSVVADFGANIGYLISSNGFQKGAYAASELTNVQLVTWEEFQDVFEETWYEQYFCPTLTERLDPLLTYTEPLYPDWVDKLPPHEKRNYFALSRKYIMFAMMIMNLTTYVRIFSRGSRPTLPFAEHIASSEAITEIPNDLLTAIGYRQLFDLAVEYGEQAISEFRTIRDRNNLTED